MIESCVTFPFDEFKILNHNFNLFVSFSYRLLCLQISDDEGIAESGMWFYNFLKKILTTNLT